jgi:hypothetical protein
VREKGSERNRETKKEQENERNRMKETENMLLEGNQPRSRGSLIRGIR